MYQVLDENCSPCLRKNLVRLRELNRGHNLRNQETDLALQKPKTNFLKRSFKYSASMLWKNLSLDAKRATSSRQFEHSIAELSF
jgi:phage antirepressor YoqD-like protein